MSVDDSSGERVQEELAACSAQSSRAPAQTRVSVPHQLSEYQHSRKYGRIVWHRHSCLCLGEMDCLSLLTHKALSRTTVPRCPTESFVQPLRQIPARASHRYSSAATPRPAMASRCP